MSTPMLLSRRGLEREAETAASTAGRVFAPLESINPGLAEQLEAARAEQTSAEAVLADVDRRIRRLHPPAVYREEIPGQRRQDFDVLDPVEREITLEDLVRERGDALRRVKTARERCKQDAIKAVNVLLRAQRVNWTTVADETATVTDELNQRIPELVGLVLRLGDARVAERRRVNAMVETAKQAASNDETRREIDHLRRVGDVPVSVDESGVVETVQRPERDLLVSFARLVEVLELALREPAVARKRLRGSALGAAAGID